MLVQKRSTLKLTDRIFIVHLLFLYPDKETPNQVLCSPARPRLRPGNVLLIHSSLRALGWVCGGAPAVISALLDAPGPTGTLVMPTHSTQLTDPAGWTSPPVPNSWWQIIREQALPYNPAITPTRGMGQSQKLFGRGPEWCVALIRCFRLVLMEQEHQRSFPSTQQWASALESNLRSRDFTIWTQAFFFSGLDSRRTPRFIFLNTERPFQKRNSLLRVRRCYSISVGFGLQCRNWSLIVATLSRWDRTF